jgi:uncharacterized protein
MATQPIDNKRVDSFNLANTLAQLKKYLPTQAPLKDFVPNNILQSFQSMPFHEAMRTSSKWFGYRTYITLPEYRAEYAKGRIREAVLDRVIVERHGLEGLKLWKERLLTGAYDEMVTARVGEVRNKWKWEHKVNLDKEVHILLFKIVNAYLDQGISIWNFPVSHLGLLCSVRELEQMAFSSFFQTERARDLLFNTDCNIEDLLNILVGNPALYESYLFDQQFAHPGWSGMVSVLETRQDTLLDKRCISLKDFIALELLLEIDVVGARFGGHIEPLGNCVHEPMLPLLSAVEETELSEVYAIWQEAFEWSFYDQVLLGIQESEQLPSTHKDKTFQTLMCIDDRIISFRSYLEQLDKNCETFGTPGFFNVECYFQPEHGKFHTKICPAPITPKYIIKETDTVKKMGKDTHFTKQTHSLFGGLLISLTFGFWSLFKLIFGIFRPSHTAMMVSSFKHMDKNAKLTIEHTGLEDAVDGLQVGYTITEMVDRMEGLLRSIGLVDNFAPIVYVIGHGASSVNNTYYAEYDCGACCSRPGSVNARSAAFMLNHSKVREQLAVRGINIPVETQFVGGLHDTTRDEIEYYDEKLLSDSNSEKHRQNISIFEQALSLNAKERSRRFILVDSRGPANKIHRQVLKRAYSLFEPRPEMNHANNALCIVGKRNMTEHLFLDRRAFLNSYDYKIDTDGKYLTAILNAATPVCGGINLQFYFSRVDNYRLGAGSKLPHNVMGLYGIANGMEGDLRTGLPRQVIEIHEAIRLMMVVEQYPDVVLDVIKRNPATYEWYNNNWMPLIVIHPDSRQFYRFEKGAIVPYNPVPVAVPKLHDLNKLIETQHDHLPVYVLQPKNA